MNALSCNRFGLGARVPGVLFTEVNGVRFGELLVLSLAAAAV